MYTNNPQKPNPRKPQKLSSEKSVISSLSDVCGGGGVRYSTVKVKAKTPIPVMTIAGAVVITLLFMFIIFSFVQIAELSSDISSMKSDMASLSADAETLRGRLDYKYTKSQIEKTASDIGLDSKQNTTVFFAGEDSEDVSEIIQPETKFSSTMSTLLGAISKNFRKFIEFMN